SPGGPLENPPSLAPATRLPTFEPTPALTLAGKPGRAGWAQPGFAARSEKRQGARPSPPRRLFLYPPPQAGGKGGARGDLAIRLVVRGGKRSHLVDTTEVAMTDAVSPNPSQLQSPLRLSHELAALVAAAAQSVVTVHGGGRRPSSGVIWQPGIVVT